MGSSASSRILLCAAEPAVVSDLHHALEQAGHAAGWHPLDAGDPGDVSGYHLVVVEGSLGRQDALHFCRRLRTRWADPFVPILFVAGDQSPGVRQDSFEHGADVCLIRPFPPGDLLGQVRACLNLKERYDRLAEKAAEAQRSTLQLQLAYQQIDQELELARHIQQSFLPASLPEAPGVRFAVHYQPCGRVGGDFYDVFRLDEKHLGFYVADAMGHGVPASLLTIYLKKGVRAKEIFGQEYRLVPPSEVLQRLNRDLIELGLSESRFNTMVYGLFNGRDGTLQFARAGHPYPVHVPADGEPRLLRVEGSLLGVFETSYPLQSQQLRPGDKVLFYTDGRDGVSFEGSPAGSASLLACAGRHRALPIQEFIERLSKDLRQADHADDFTLLGLEMRSGGGNRPFSG